MTKKRTRQSTRRQAKKLEIARIQVGLLNTLQPKRNLKLQSGQPKTSVMRLLDLQYDRQGMSKGGR